MAKKLPLPKSIFKNCGVCGTKGEIGTCFSASIFVIEIRRIWKKVRSYYKVPEKYSHWFYGGYGSIGFDGSLVFLTPEQAKGLPHFVCENCVMKKLANQSTYNYDYFADYNFTEEKKEINIAHFSIRRIPTCSKCGKTLQEKTVKLPGMNIHHVRRVTRSERKEFQIPNDLQYYIFDWHLLGFSYPKCGLGNFFFIPNEGLANSSLCDACLRKALKGKTIKVFSLNDKKWRKFKVK